MNQYVEAVRKEASLICDQLDLILFSVEEIKENGMNIIQVLVDPKEGQEISIDEITPVIEKLQAVVEKKDLIPDDYYLEVSSVGVERPLRSIDELNKAIGEYIYIELNNMVEKKSDWYGTLEKVENNNVYLFINIKGKKKLIEVPYGNIVFARIAIKF